jgi:hypothetical protein
MLLPECGEAVEQEDGVVQRDGHLQDRLTTCVIKDILPKKTFVPMLISTAAPIAARNSRGSSQEFVAISRIARITGMRIAMALSTSVADILWAWLC